MAGDNKQISSPFSTGEGGASFETKVQAAFAAMMLAGAAVPTRIRYSIGSIKLQRRYEGYSTDDLVVECKNPETNQTCKLLVQIKHSITITQGNEELSDVISDAWSDFNNSELFSHEDDSIALITGPLSKIDIEHVRPILDWARHSENSVEFFQKVGTPGFSSDKKREKLAVLKHHIEQANKGKPPKDEAIWQFLKCFHLIGYDFDATTGSDLSLILSMLKLSLLDNTSPDMVWAKLIDTVQDFNKVAGTITAGTMPREVAEYFRIDISLTTRTSIYKLRDHGDIVLKGIRTNIADTHVNRTRYIEQLAEQVNKFSFVIVTGSRGSGKSAVVKEFFEEHRQIAPSFCLRAEDLNESHLDKVFTSIGIGASLSELSAMFAMMPEKYLVIDSLEKLLELNHRTAFCDLLEFVRANREWTVIASCREYALQQISSTYLQYQGVSHSILKVDEFSEDEFNALLLDNPELAKLAVSKKLSKLLKNPFMADMAVRVISSKTQSKITDEVSFKKVVWQSVICKESERAGGMPLKRAQVFTGICVQRAKEMVYDIPESGFAEDAMYELEADGLLCRNSEKGFVRPAHDVLEDWAIEEFIEKTHQSNRGNHSEFFRSIGNEPSIIRAFRFWLHSRLNIAQNPTEIRDWCINVIDDINVPTHWNDEIVIAILSGQYTANFLILLQNRLLESRGELLKRFCFLMRLACKVSNTEAISNIPDSGIKQHMSFMFYKAWGDCWSDMLKFLYEHRNEIDFESIPEVPLILEDYSSLTNVDGNPPEASKEAGLLALFLLETVKDEYRHSEVRQRLLKTIIKVVPEIETEFEELLKRDVFGKTHRGRPAHVEHLMKYVLVDLETATLCKHCPSLVTQLAWQEWTQKDEYTDDPFCNARIEVEECFGLSHNYDLRDFHPASGLKGPFWALLTWHESTGLDFIIELCNYTANKYVNSRLDGPGNNQIDVVLNDGTIHKQFCSGRLWGGYRGITVLPNLLQSALMALENWLIAKAQKGDEVALPKILNDILRRSNSVMTTAVIASIVTGFPEESGDAVWPLLCTEEFYGLDMQRRIHDSGMSSINWHRTALLTDVYSPFYAQERDTSNSHKWRKEGLEFLVCKLQFTQKRDKVHEIIDHYFKKFAQESPDSEAWRFRLSRVDLRNCKAIEDVDNNCVRFVSTTELDPDLQKKSEASQEQLEEMQGFTSLFMWAEKEFGGESTKTQYFQDFREALSSIKQNAGILRKSGKERDLSCWADGVIKGAAVLIRDYGKQLEEVDSLWCIELLLNAMTEHMGADNQVEVSTFGKAAISATQVLPIILEHTSEMEKVKIRQLIAFALTHRNNDFRKNIAVGIQKHLWQRESDLAQRCFDGAFEYARLQQQRFDDYDPLRNDDKTSEFDKRVAELRSQIVNDISSVDLHEVSFSSHSHADLLTPFLMIPDTLANQQHTALLLHMITLIQDAEGDDRNDLSRRERNLDPTEKFEFVRCLTRHLMTLPASERRRLVQCVADRIVDALDLADDLLIISLAESERVKSVSIFWEIWEQIAIAVQNSIETVFSCRTSGRDGKRIIDKLLFADFPSQQEQHREELCEILTYGKVPLLAFVQKACNNVTVYEGFARLVLHFSQLFLLDGLPILGSTAEEDVTVLDGINTVYYLEHLLRRILVSGSSSRCIRSDIYSTCLVLLNAMVEKGSTSAFFLREHLLSMKHKP